jgi:hypothetical protein
MVLASVQASGWCLFFLFLYQRAESFSTFQMCQTMFQMFQEKQKEE